MKTVPASAALFPVFVLCVAATSTAAAQTNSKALFGPQWDPPWICVGGGFVAMLGIGYHRPLIVVAIDSHGIEAPQRLSIEGNEAFGMQCLGSYVELLVREEAAGKADSDHFSVLPFRVEQIGIEQGTIKREQREDLDYSLALKAPMPSAIERRIDEFHRPDPSSLLGDWYVPVPRVVNFRHAYAVHFRRTETRSPQGALVITLAVDLLEQAVDGKHTPFSIKDGTVTQSVSLIREQTIQGRGD